eukprot:scaffold6730_cov113-Chaetoceros_neogracile.AAC.1
MLCSGCVFAHGVAAAYTERFKCVFCRTKAPSSDEVLIERIEKRVEANDAQAMFNLGSYYQLGMKGLRQDNSKALELYRSIVEKDTRKATYHRQLAAMAGN